MVEPRVRYAKTEDGISIAYAQFDSHAGLPLVEIRQCYSTLERRSESPESRALTEALARTRPLISYDRRGIGASQRDVDNVSLDTQVGDVAAIVDDAELQQFDLAGWIDGAAVAIAFAAVHPDRVARLVLYVPTARGDEVVSPADLKSGAEIRKTNWPLAARMIIDAMSPYAPPDTRRRYAEQLQRDASPTVAGGYFELMATFDVSDFLPRVQAETLVFHPSLSPAEHKAASQRLAASIRNATFATLDSGSPSTNPEGTAQLISDFLDAGRRDTSAIAADTHTILFTDMQSSTALTERLGDVGMQSVRGAHNQIVRDALRNYAGSEIKHTGDGIMAAFATASAALECAIAIQRGVVAHRDQQPGSPLAVYVGLNAGEPIAEDDDLYGTSVNLAARVCDHARADQIVASDVVRQLAAGKGFLFSDLGETELRGFEDPVRLWELRWEDNDT